MDKPIEKLLEFITNYHGDLKYQFDQDGLEYVNYNSCATPYFETETEFKLYALQLETAIKMMGENQ